MSENQTEKNTNSIIVPGTNLAAKLAWLQTNAQINGSYTIEVNTDESISTKYQSLSYDGKNNITINLRGVGSNRVISLSSEGCIFIVENGVTLVLDKNITLRGKNNNNRPLVAVSGALIMNHGSTITGNKNNDTDKPCGGVFVLKGGTFTMNGGTISENNTASRHGGGVAVDGIFTMNDGTISNNNAEGGAGVFVQGIFNMNGGFIFGNWAEVGGGVYVWDKATFTMFGGTISGNTANLGGGGVTVAGTFIMKDGIISSNTVIGESPAGGGVYVLGMGHEGFFDKTGGTITGYASDTIKGNVVKDPDETIKSNLGHAIWGAASEDNYECKDTTAGPTDKMFYEAKEGYADGVWDKKPQLKNKQSSGGCYIATCVYGSYDCPEVWILRRYRDSDLSASWFGRCFIQIYYAVSPKIVGLFGNKKWFSSLWKPVLNKFVCKLLQSSIDNSPYSDM